MCIHTYICIQNLGQGFRTSPALRWPPRPTWAPSWPARLACWACQGLSTAFLGLSTACPGLQGASWTPIGRQLDANWTPSERQIGLPKPLPVATCVLRTPKQLPSTTELLASSSSLSMDIDRSTLVYIFIYVCISEYGYMICF